MWTVGATAPEPGAEGGCLVWKKRGRKPGWAEEGADGSGWGSPAPSSSEYQEVTWAEGRGG